MWKRFLTRQFLSARVKLLCRTALTIYAAYTGKALMSCSGRYSDVRKINKYEFKALSSVLLPIFGAMLVMGILAPVFVSLPDITGGRFFIAQILTVIYIVIYACLLFGGGLMCLIATVIRFKKNLLGDEGYLMHTLPVKKWQLTASKVIAAVSMQLLGGLAAAVSGIIFHCNERSLGIQRHC